MDWRASAGLVVIFDDGHGDTFCFGRYLKILAACAEDVVAIMSGPEYSLIERNANGFRLAPLNTCSEDLGRADACASMHRLPHQTEAGYGEAKWLSAERAENRDGMGLQAPSEFELT